MFSIQSKELAWLPRPGKLRPAAERLLIDNYDGMLQKVFPLNCGLLGSLGMLQKVFHQNYGLLGSLGMLQKAF